MVGAGKRGWAGLGYRDNGAWTLNGMRGHDGCLYIKGSSCVTRTSVATARIQTSRLGRQPRMGSISVVNLPTSDIASCMV